MAKSLHESIMEVLAGYVAAMRLSRSRCRMTDFDNKIVASVRYRPSPTALVSRAVEIGTRRTEQVGHVVGVIPQIICLEVDRCNSSEDADQERYTAELVESTWWYPSEVSDLFCRLRGW